LVAAKLVALVLPLGLDTFAVAAALGVVGMPLIGLAVGAPLIWTFVCQVPSTGCPRLGRASLSVKGAAGLAGARRAVRLICAGWLPQDRVSS
jgi:hypothetical protein